MDVIVRLPHPQSRDSQGRETFLAPSADKPTPNYDIECANHHPSLSSLRPKRLSRRKMKWWTIHRNWPVDVIVRLPHPRSGDSQGQETFLSRSADKPTRNYDIEYANHHPYVSNLTPKGLSRSKMKWLPIYRNLPIDVLVRLPHPRSGDCQGQETFLAPFADKQTCNYNIECSNHHPLLSTLRLKGLSRSKMKWCAIHTNLPVDVIVRLPHPWSGDSRNQETFLAPSRDKPTRNDSIECSNHSPSRSTLRPKGLSHSKMKWWAIHTNLTVDVIVRLPHSRTGKRKGQETFLAPSADKQARNYDIECSNHHPLLSTLRLKGLSPSRMKWLAIDTNLPVDFIVTLPHPRSGDSEGQESFLAPSADKEIRNFDIECSNHHPALSTRRAKGMSSSKMNWWAIHANLTVDVITRLRHPGSGYSQNQETFLAPSAEKPTRNYHIERSNHHLSLSPQAQRDWAVARWNGEPYIQIYQWMSYSDYPILGMEIARARKRFYHPLVTSKPVTMI